MGDNMTKRDDYNMDGMCRAVVAKCGLEGAVPWVMMASVLYYHCDVSLLSDELYDQLMRDIYDNWDSILHTHKWILSKDAAQAGTAYHLTVAQYPYSVRAAAFTAISNTVLDVSPELRKSIQAVEFVPPEYCWDTYIWGPNGQTWRDWKQTSKIRTRPLPSLEIPEPTPAPPPTLTPAQITPVVDAPVNVVIEATPEAPREPTIRIRKRVRV